MRDEGRRGSEARVGGANWRRNYIGFGGVEVARAGVYTEGPRGGSGGFPGGEGKGIEEKLRD